MSENQKFSESHQDSGATMSGPKISPQSRDIGAEGIEDNAKRSVSIRINTSDFGKIKTIARRLRVRESEVFRYLMRRSLKAVGPMYQNDTRRSEIIDVLMEDNGELISEFNLDTDKIGQLFDQVCAQDGARLDKDDQELLAMVNMPEKFLALRLSEILGQKIEPADVVTTLDKYLENKYGLD